MELIYALIATFIISLISLIGVFTLAIKKTVLEKILFFFISFSAGSLMGGAFFHLIPESLENNLPSTIFQSTILGFIIFFILEKILHWHHCQNQHCTEHKALLGFQNLFGDALHNFIDGLVIMAAFSISPSLGIVTTFSVALHEIPQEISDFGVLLYSGFSKQKAILYNLLSAFFAIFGALIGYLLILKTEQITQWLIPITAGGFIYIAASDLIPELNKEKDFFKSLLSLIFFILALLIMRFI